MYIILAMILIGICFVYSIAMINYPIYKATGEINLGLSGGINALFSGVIANVFELVLLVIGLYYLSRDTRKQAANPQGLVAVD